MFLSTWPRKKTGSFENVRIHDISCQLTKFYNFTPKCLGQDLAKTHLKRTMVAKIEIFDAWLAMKKFFIIRNIILAKIEV